MGTTSLGIITSMGVMSDMPPMDDTTTMGVIGTQTPMIGDMIPLVINDTQTTMDVTTPIMDEVTLVDVSTSIVIMTIMNVTLSIGILTPMPVTTPMLDDMIPMNVTPPIGVMTPTYSWGTPSFKKLLKDPLYWFCVLIILLLTHTVTNLFRRPYFPHKN